MARSYSARCGKDDVSGDWNCEEFTPRGYLTLAGQEAEVVIIGSMERDEAVTLVEFAKQKLRDRYSDIDRWRFVSIVPPGEYSDSFHLSLKNASGESFGW